MDDGKTILCIDDDADDRSLLTEIVMHHQQKFKVAEAVNGVEGLRYLNEAKIKNLPCLIVLDINMPLLDGRQTLLKIKEDENLRQIPIVVYTSSASPYDKHFFENHGVAYFTKPVTMENWKKAIGAMLNYCNTA